MARQRQTRHSKDDDRANHTSDAALPDAERGTPGEPTQAQIAECAYFIWLAKGSPSEQDEACWYEAEEQLRAGRTRD